MLAIYRFTGYTGPLMNVRGLPQHPRRGQFPLALNVILIPIGMAASISAAARPKLEEHDALERRVPHLGSQIA